MVMGRPREFDTERALDSATELFWRKGYEGTSLSDLTSTLGITRPSLYAAFGNKEALFLMALDRYEARAGAYRVKALEAPTAYEVARQLLHGVVNLHGDRNNPAGCMGVQSALVCGDDSATLCLPPHLPVAAFLRSRAALSFATKAAFSNCETAPRTCRTRLITRTARRE